MAVAYDTASAVQTISNVSTIPTINHTASGSDRYVRFSAGWAKLGTATLTATYGGNAMTAVGEAVAAASWGSGVTGRAKIFGYIAPSTSSEAVVGTFTSAGTYGACGVVSYTGVDQTTPDGAAVSATGFSNAPSVTVTDATTGDMVSDALATEGGASLTAGQTQRFSANSSGYRGAGQDAAGSGSVAMGWSLPASVNWAQVAAAIFQASGGGATTHATSGALAAAGATIAGTAAHIAKHATTGVLAGSGATVAGSAARTRAHPASGVLAGGGASLAGTARHNAPHPTSGALAGGGAEIAGAADHAVPGGTHDTSGALEGGGASVAGTAAHIAVHATSGVLAGSGAVVDGTAARVAAAVTHATSGALVGGGAQVSGLARGPEPDAVPRRHAGFRREQVRKGYIIKGERYWLTEDELMQMVAQELATISRKDVKQITKTKPKVISKQVWDAIKPLERLEALTPIEPTQDDDEEDVLMMFV